jgi:hypothetical protein
MTLNYSVLAQLLYVPWDRFSHSEFSVLVGEHQTARNYKMYYSNRGIRFLVVTEDRLNRYREVFSPDWISYYAEVVEIIRKLEGDNIEDIGPIFLCLLDPSKFILPDQISVCGYPLTKLDETHIPSLKELKVACKQLEWEHASLVFENLDTAFGALDGEEVVAVAHNLVFNGDIASIGIVTHPDYRSRGLVTALAVRAIHHALASCYHVIYCTMGYYQPAIRVARKLNFTPAGEYYMLRLG